MEERKTIPLKDLTARFGKIVCEELLGWDDNGSLWGDKEYTADEFLQRNYTEDDFCQPDENENRIYYSRTYDNVLIASKKGLRLVHPRGDWVQARILSNKDLFILAGHDGLEVYELEQL